MDTVEHPTVDHFHQLRINLKRIRFIQRLLVRYGIRGASHCFEPYTTLFRFAGTIRQLHLHAMLITTYAKEGEQKRLLDYIQKKELQVLKKWPLQASAFLATLVLNHTRIYQTIEGITKTTIAFSNELKGRIITRFGSDMPDHKLHKSRKVLKEIVYSREISAALKSRLASTYHLRNVMTLEDAIGDWHDLDLLLQHGLPHQHRLTRKMRTALDKKKLLEREKISRLIPKLLQRQKT